MTEVKSLRTISIPDPEKEISALFKWLLDNTSKDTIHPSMACVKVFPGRVYYATNGSGMIRAEVFDDGLDFVLPGLYTVMSCTSKLLHLLELEDIGYPNVESLYFSFKADLSDARLACYDPKFLTRITKPFETVYMLAAKCNVIELVLEDSLLPFGKYTGILMGKSSNKPEHFYDFFPAPEPAETKGESK